MALIDNVRAENMTLMKFSFEFETKRDKETQMSYGSFFHSSMLTTV